MDETVPPVLKSPVKETCDLVCRRAASSPECCLLLASSQGQQVDSVRRKQGAGGERVRKIFLSLSLPLCLISPEYLLSKYDGVYDLRNEKE